MPIDIVNGIDIIKGGVGTRFRRIGRQMASRA
jgi:hypothetical protein